MKISQVIALLQARLAEVGDIEVRAFDDDGCRDPLRVVAVYYDKGQPYYIYLGS